MKMCLWCGNDLSKVQSAKEGTNTCGTKKGCRQAYTEYKRKEETTLFYAIKKGEWEEQPDIRHNRKCRRCSKPCYPNYFLCPTCFSGTKDYASYFGGRTI